MSQEFSDNEDIFINLEELLSNYNNIFDNVSPHPATCSYCNLPNHSMEYCTRARSIGQNLHLKALEVKEFDIELECNGESIKVWLETLTDRQLSTLAQRVNLTAYAYSLWDREIINHSVLLMERREDIILCLRYFYYIEPLSLMKKHNFTINLIITPKVTEEEEEVFECPICIENISVDEKIQFNCSHSVCNTCFNNYLNNLKKNETACCCLCRSNTKIINVNNKEIQDSIKIKYNL
jgi:hypothetical protein